MSADRNIDQGDNSRSATAVDLSGLMPLSPAVAAASFGANGTVADGAGAAGAVDADGTVSDGADAAGAATAGGCDDTGACGGAATGFCWASDGDASDSIASARIKPQIARKDDVFILRSSSERMATESDQFDRFRVLVTRLSQSSQVNGDVEIEDQGLKMRLET
jgi:hypothetical protein